MSLTIHRARRYGVQFDVDGVYGYASAHELERQARSAMLRVDGYTIVGGITVDRTTVAALIAACNESPPLHRDPYTHTERDEDLVGRPPRLSIDRDDLGPAQLRAEASEW